MNSFQSQQLVIIPRSNLQNRLKKTTELTDINPAVKYRGVNIQKRKFYLFFKLATKGANKDDIHAKNIANVMFIESEYQRHAISETISDRNIRDKYQRNIRKYQEISETGISKKE